MSISRPNSIGPKTLFTAPTASQQEVPRYDP